MRHIIFPYVIAGTYSLVFPPLFVIFTPADTKTRPSVASIWREQFG